jgi:sulfopyruvate decarboxylase alpha subunit
MTSASAASELQTRAGPDERSWQEQVFETLKANEISIVGYVPDAGHSTVIKLCKQDPTIADIVLTTEEEGIGLCAGAWLGGKRSILLMQSSGVGNCINTLSLQQVGRFPLVVLVTMRGEYAEFNPWQIPMGSITEDALRLCNVMTYRAAEPADAVDLVQAAIDISYGSNVATAVLFSQRLIGRKKWVR